MATLLPVRRTQSERRDESEARLLAAAARLIEAEGFAAVTFDRVGAEAGYSRGLAAHKFGSKDGLVRAVIAFVQQRVQQRIDGAMATLARPSPAQQVLAWTDTLLAAVQSDIFVRVYFVMMAAAIGNRAAIRPAFLEAHEEVRTRLRELIEDGQAAGEISGHVHADATALSIGSLQLGIATELLLDPAMDMDAMRRSAHIAVKGMLGI